MANYNGLIATISAAIRANGNEEITGQLLQGVLLTIVNKLGDGYQFGGIATPSGTPAADADARVFYLAFQAGTYTNFGGVVVPRDGVYILKYDSTWALAGGHADNVLVAVYGSTTFAEITAALSANKAIFAVNGTRIFSYGGVLSSGAYVFYAIQAARVYSIAVSSSNAWESFSILELQRVSNMEQSVSTSTTKYPSSKAVKDYVDAHAGPTTPIEVDFAGAAGFDDPELWSYAEAASIGLTSDAIYDMITKHAPLIDISNGQYRWLNYSIECSTLTPDPNDMENAMYDIYIQWISNNASQIRMRSLHIYNEPEEALYVYDHTVSLT